MPCDALSLDLLVFHIFTSEQPRLSNQPFPAELTSHF